MALKKEMEQLDRRIQLALKPVGNDQDGEAVQKKNQNDARQKNEPQQQLLAGDDPLKLNDFGACGKVSSILSGMAYGQPDR